jgi:hypothetical protein
MGGGTFGSDDMTKRITGLACLVAIAIVAGGLGSTATAQTKDSVDQMADEMIKRALRDAIGDKAPPVAPQPPAGPVTPLQANTTNDAPIPLPDGADDVELNGPNGKLEFTSTASVAAIAAFYHQAMKPLGWRERPSVINRPNMVVIDFIKADNSISMTIMQMGKTVNVSAHGSGLIVKSPRTAATPGASPGATPAALQELEADEKAGLPFPKRNTMSGTERTPFRLVLNVQTDATLASVLAFYRRELGKRNWTTVGEKTSTEPEQATISFKSPDGPAVLKLHRERDETIVALAVRNTAAATKAGVAPKPGQGKMLFGNILDKEAVIAVNGKTVKVGPGVGAKAPDGPTLELPPGKHRVSFRIAGGPARTEEVTIGADETWALMIGPGGALSLQVY